MSTSPTSLFLAPVDVREAPPRAAVQAVLEQLEIIADVLDDQRFAAGRGFSRHVVFAGCSPHLVMDPPADGSLAFCHVALHGPFEQARLVTGPNTVKPRCPGCRARFDDWRTRLAAWRAGETAHCDSCGASLPAVLLDWRGHALGGRILVELRNVFPGEASPSDLLLHRLQQASGGAWRYAWAGYLLRP